MKKILDKKILDERMLDKKVLLFSRDPGGANTIIPLVSKLEQKYEVLLFGKDIALQKYEQNQLSFQDIKKEYNNINIDSMKSFLKKYNPDFIITGTSADDNTEKYLWKAGEALDIPSFAILDQWVNYGIRFSKYSVSQAAEYQKNKIHSFMPTRILVMDKYAKREMLLEGIPEEKILVSGQPYFDCFIEQMEKINQDMVLKCKEIIKSENNPVIVFVSEPICKTYGENRNYWGYTEETIFQEFHTALKKVTEQLHQKVKVLIRPHPKEELEEWNDRLENTKYISYEIDKDLDGKVVIKMADIICGMSSMFLIESVLCNKNIISIQIGLKKENPFVLDRKGVIKSILSGEELERKMQYFLKGEKEQYQWDVPDCAVEKVIQLMEELV